MAPNEKISRRVRLNFMGSGHFFLGACKDQVLTTCTPGDYTIASGALVFDTEKCNRCSCGENQMLACTMMACESPNSDALCAVGNNYATLGQIVTRSSDAASCTCQSDGTLLSISFDIVL